MLTGRLVHKGGLRRRAPGGTAPPAAAERPRPRGRGADSSERARPPGLAPRGRRGAAVLAARGRDDFEPAAVRSDEHHVEEPSASLALAVDLGRDLVRLAVVEQAEEGRDVEAVRRHLVRVRDRDRDRVRVRVTVTVRVRLEG